MLSGDVNSIRRSITFDGVVQSVGDSIMYIRTPDNTEYVEVTYSVETSADELTVTLISDPYTFTLSGRYDIKYFIEVSIGGVSSKQWRTDVIWVWNTYIYPNLYQEGRLSSATVPTTWIDRLMPMIWQKIRQNITCLPEYYTVDESEKLYLDNALMYLALIKLSQTTFSKNPSGDLIGYKFQQVQYTFSATKDSNLPLSNVDRWMNEAIENLSYMACMVSTMTDRKTVPLLFNVSGPTRNRQASGRDSLFAVSASMLSNTIDFTTIPYSADIWYF